LQKQQHKIINDPVYGFINIPSRLIYDLIQHPYFQRLRRIKQLGLADLVYPGALHTRFHHALGAMHLMAEALKNIRSKGTQISDSEFEAAQIAILLHDIGHGPFSHVLEHTLLAQVPHEALSVVVMQKLNIHFGGKLSLALDMFQNKYQRPFFNQLISSQLDIDRLDYLNRDSFFTGVTEASIGSERIIKMMQVIDDQLVVEQKGIYSIENFLNARRFMYWQVYLHKTAICGEVMLQQIMARAKNLLGTGTQLSLMPNLEPFLSSSINIAQLSDNQYLLEQFMQLDDIDIWASIKLWKQAKDPILSQLCTMLLERKIFKIRLQDQKIPDHFLNATQLRLMRHQTYINKETVSYFISSGIASNAAYKDQSQNINILSKEGKIVEISQASDLPTIKALSNIVKKYYVCWANDVYL
jgi:uncharacterized protein